MCSLLMCFVGSQIASGAAAAAAAADMKSVQQRKRPMCCTITLVVFAILFLALSLTLLIAFPSSIYPALVKSQIPLKEKVDGSYTQLTGFWKNLPQLAKYDFYFFNITNVDEMLYEGAKPHLVEVGPYSYMETEFKEGLEWLDDNKKVHYRSNKTWVYQQSTSCAGCSEDDIVTLPNAAYATTMALKAQNDMDSRSARVLDLLLTIVGEGPIRSVTVGGSLFAGYDDPLLDVINSNFVNLLGQLSPGGLNLPQVPYMGFLPHYNHTADEDYLLRTGQDDPLMAFQIEQWAGQDRLSWWSGEAAEIKGAGDGTFYKPFIKRDDVLKNFQSFSCRAYEMEAEYTEVFNGIDTLVFAFKEDSYDANKEHNFGYTYENKERVDYFPEWPACKPEHKYQPWNLDCSEINCRLDVNFCHDCCDGSHYERTILLPPGIVPLRCFPGQNKRLPFSGFVSPPHFASSPKEVHDTMVGLKPDAQKHEPGRWWINAETGGTIHAIFNMQLTIPIYNDVDFMMTTHMRHAFLPAFWSQVDANLKPYAHDFIMLSAQTAPTVAMAVGWSLLILAALFLAISFCCFRRAGARVTDLEVNTLVASSEKKIADPSPVKVVGISVAGRRQESPAEMYPQLYAKDSPEGSLSWKSKTLEKTNGEAWS